MEINDLKISVENIRSLDTMETVIRVNIKGVHQTFRQYTYIHNIDEYKDLYSFGYSLEMLGKLIRRQAEENKLTGD